MGFTIFILFLLLKSSAAVSTRNLTNLFTTVLVFGDSTVDSGNNNYILTPFRADHSPYGRDFPGGVPTGRFSNGKLVPDFWASEMGIKDTVPPYLQPNLSDFDIRTGVNFASAGSGFDALTTQDSQVIPMTRQVHYFRGYTKRLTKIVGVEEAKKIIKNALVSVTAGTNDFTISYYDFKGRRNDFTVEDYQDYILKKLENFITELYKLGCRTMVVSGLPPMGCLPIQISWRSLDGKCVKKENYDARIYNQKLKSLLAQMQAALGGSRILYNDIYYPMVEMLRNPRKHGIIHTKAGCCGSGYWEAGPICTLFTPLCENTSSYLFFDSIHPSETAYRYVTRTSLNMILRHMNSSVY